MESQKYLFRLLQYWQEGPLLPGNLNNSKEKVSFLPFFLSVNTLFKREQKQPELNDKLASFSSKK